MVRSSTFIALWLPFAFAVGGEENAAAKYDPMETNANFRVPLLELTVHDGKRNRDIPVRVYLPESNQPAPVVLFSHGLGGSRSGNEFLGQHWARRGYVGVFIQHPGSDTLVWKDKPPEDRLSAMREAASLENFELRAADVPAVLDQLEAWNANSQSLTGRMDLKKIGMSGHSFGAITTQAVSGENFPIIGKKLTDPRIKAAIAFSPSAPSRSSAETAFAEVKIPWLLMTGTKDIASVGHADLKSRLAVYPALHGAPKYEVVLNNAEHSAFTDRALPGDEQPRNPNHHRVMCALTTAFLDAFLRDDATALRWLNGDGPRSIMEPEDRWQFSPK